MLLAWRQEFYDPDVYQRAQYEQSNTLAQFVFYIYFCRDVRNIQYTVNQTQCQASPVELQKHW